jgi:replicative DNA helicase
MPEIVKERALLRELVSAWWRDRRSVWSEEGESARELVEKAERRIFAIAEGSARGKGYVSARQALPPLIDMIDDLYNNPNKPRGLPTGSSISTTKTGGLRGGDLLIIAGRPSMGKTTLAINMREHAALKGRRARVGRHLLARNAGRSAADAHVVVGRQRASSATSAAASCPKTTGRVSRAPPSSSRTPRSSSTTRRR